MKSLIIFIPVLQDSLLTSSISQGQREGQSGSKECFFRLQVHKKGQTNTGLIKGLLEMLKKLL